MTPEDIKKIEEETNLKLPTHYIEVITNYPSELLNSDAQDFGLWNSPDEVIEENNTVRKNGYYGEKWPNNYLIIGHNGCGDHYVTVLDGDHFSVGFSDHEEMRCTKYADSLEEFIRKYLTQQEEI